MRGTLTLREQLDAVDRTFARRSGDGGGGGVGGVRSPQCLAARETLITAFWAEAQAADDLAADLGDYARPLYTLNEARKEQDRLGRTGGGARYVITPEPTPARMYTVRAVREE